MSSDAVLAPGRRMALLAAGDWWAYDGEGEAQRDGSTVALRGSVRVDVEQRMVAGRQRTAIVFTPHWRIVSVDGVGAASSVFPMPQGLFYFEQDRVTRDLFIVGDNMGEGGTDRFANAPQLFYPGHFDAATAYDNVLDFGAAGQVANTLRVVGIEPVVTALGLHAAWKAPISSDSAQFGRIEGCDHWRPGLGAPLRFAMVAHARDGSRLSTVAVLRASNRAID